MLFILPLFLLAFNPLLAEHPLYETVVSVSDRSNDTWNAAIQTAAEHVLKKVSGEIDLPDDEEFQLARQALNHGVNEYAYDDQGNQMRLRVVFNPGSIDHLLKKANLSVWSSPRPHTQLWLQLQHFNQAELITNLQKWAHAYALTINIPATAQQTRFFQQVNLDDSSSLQKHSLQTADTGILVAVEQGDLLDWTLVYGHESTRWQSAISKQNSIPESVIHHLNQMYKQQNQESTHKHATVLVEFNGLNSFHSYQNLMTLMKKITQGESMHIMVFENSHVLIKITLDHDLQALTDRLVESHNLVVNQDASYFESADLSFQWLETVTGQ